MNNKCNYTISLDDRLVGKIRSRFKNEESLSQWMQQQLELVVLNYAENKNEHQNMKEETRKRLEMLAAGKPHEGLKDLKGIMALANTTIDELRQGYISDKYNI